MCPKAHGKVARPNCSLDFDSTHIVPYSKCSDTSCAQTELHWSAEFPAPQYCRMGKRVNITDRRISSVLGLRSTKGHR